MKRTKLVFAGAALLAAAPCWAAINPSAPGLPQNWNTNARGYRSGIAVGGATRPLSTTDSWAAVMCVECHEVNPSDKITAPSFRSGGYTPSRTADWGTHAVMNIWATAATDAFGTTHSGGGFTGGFAGARSAGEYEKVTAWTTSTGRSKYGNGTAYQSVLTAGDMTCESCHNILVNLGNQLLLGEYSNTNVDTLCIACHGTGGAAETYAGFQANGNLKNFNGASRKRHHVLNGETLNTAAGGPYNPDSDPATNDSIMWAAGYSKELGTGKFASWTYATTIADGAAFAFRNQVNVSGAGTLAGPMTAGDIASGTELRCTSCHRPHNADTGGGAFIFRRGDGTAQPTGTPAVSYVGDKTFAPISTKTKQMGIRRQADASTDYVTSKVYGEYRPLCMGCHVGY